MARQGVGAGLGVEEFGAHLELLLLPRDSLLEARDGALQVFQLDHGAGDLELARLDFRADREDELLRALDLELDGDLLLEGVPNRGACGCDVAAELVAEHEVADGPEGDHSDERPFDDFEHSGYLLCGGFQGGICLTQTPLRRTPGEISNPLFEMEKKCRTPGRERCARAG